MHSKQVVSIGKKSDGRIYVSVSIDGKRQRFSSGEVLNQEIYPNHFTGHRREEEAKVLQAAFIVALRKGWKPALPQVEAKPRREQNTIAILQASTKAKLEGDYSRHYKRDIASIAKQFEQYLIATNLQDLTIDKLTANTIRAFLDSKKVCARSKRITKAYLSTAFKIEFEERGIKNPFKEIRLPRTTEVLHKPFKDVPAVLNELRAVDAKLHLCCALAYGCLLRPHREVRELTWGDINDDVTVISLAGNRNKGKRNRIVPIPEFVKESLMLFKSENSLPHHNIFTGTDKPYNFAYFSTLWGRFKKRSTILEADQTMYSFRHTGAIQVFERTGNLTKLQQVMGHSSLQVSLTYLRGLQVKQLLVEDMPNIRT